MENPAVELDAMTPAKALMEIVASIQQQSPHWVDNTPAPASFKAETTASHRFEFGREQRTVSYLARPKTLKRVVLDPIQKALKEKPYRNRTIYIDGGHGVGKSHLLLEAVVLLRKHPRFRVFYMHDCLNLVYAQAKSSSDAQLLVKDYLVECLTDEDLESVDIASALKAPRFRLKDLLSAVTRNLKAVNCELILVFDQHNAIANERHPIRSNYPVNIPLNGAAGAITITSGSVYNEALVNVPESTDELSFWDPFDDEEYRVWKERMASIFPDWDDDAALAMTRNVPIFLNDLVNEIKCRNCSFKEGAEAYTEDFIVTATKLYTDFIADRTSLYECFENSVRQMMPQIELAIVTRTPTSVCNPAFLDRRFCFEDYPSELIVAHHPLFRTVLARLRGYEGLCTAESLRKSQLTIAEVERIVQESNARVLSEE
ncbi:hypothetical protein HDU96_010169 [Phlyctochytrium bullatum]|nr:hypothetical protein HDU96_010169 [Phlyctochytrium bullatum]